MFSPCQQLIYGIKLRAVSHVLVDVQDVGQNAEDLRKTLWVNVKNGDYKPQNLYQIPY